MARIALASSASYVDDPEIKVLSEALAAVGHEVAVEVWDDEAVDWHAYALTVVRSTWDYTDHRDAFVEWARRVPRLRNRAEVIAWNTHKTYLRDLAEAGCPVIPTAWDVTDEQTLVAHADAWRLPVGETEWVVKPAVSAGSRDTARWSDVDDALAHSRSLVEAGRTAMLQPYVASVDAQGETAVLFAGGDYSHAVIKGALLAPGEGVRDDRDSRERITPTTATDDQLDVARQALRAASQALGGGLDLLYARVDLVAGPDGAPQVIELELTEPSLFLPNVDGAAERFAAAITTTVNSLGRV
ncbi:ATP-grasp domain-containing protein [Mumia sp. DW29H23]|uniref:ATP-grasp domain-containing protein n=1 Tax=Mumia sp. DW29H23 TaxID=3421241 RepID=UPI003D6838B7